MKTAFLRNVWILAPTVSFTFSLTAQTDTLNRKDSLGKKDGYWLVYLDRETLPVKQKDSAYFFGYEFWDNGADVFTFPKYNWKHQQMITSSPAPKQGNPTAVNGTFSWFDKSGKLEAEETYENGFPRTMASYHFYKGSTKPEIVEFLDFTKRYNHKPGSFFFQYYTKSDTTSYWYREDEKGWKANKVDFRKSQKRLNNWIKNNHPEMVVDEIEANPCMLHACGRDSATLLHLALEFGDTASAKYLIEKGINIHTATIFSRQTALHFSTGSGFKNISRILIEKGANPDVMDALGNTAVLNAVCRHDLDIVTLLVESGANPNRWDACRTTYLMSAIIYHYTDIALYLIEKSENLDMVNCKGVTALHLTVLYNNPRILKALIQKKANLDIQNEKGQTALDLARSMKNSLLIRMLENPDTTQTLPLEDR